MSRSSSKLNDTPEEALKASLRLLGYCARSEAEITKYLKRKGYSIAVATLTLEKLRRLRYADDGIFARQWAQARARSRGYGPRRIRHELTAKGVDPAIIRDAIGEVFSSDVENEHARLVLQKKFRGKDLGEIKILRRAAAYLQRQGYSETVIFSLLGAAKRLTEPC